jgi:hypothetical protein
VPLWAQANAAEPTTKNATKNKSAALAVSPEPIVSRNKRDTFLDTLLDTFPDTLKVSSRQITPTYYY